MKIGIMFVDNLKNCVIAKNCIIIDCGCKIVDNNKGIVDNNKGMVVQ